MSTAASCQHREIFAKQHVALLHSVSWSQCGEFVLDMGHGYVCTLAEAFNKQLPPGNWIGDVTPVLRKDVAEAAKDLRPQFFIHEL